MAITRTTLAVALNATDLVCSVTAATGATVGCEILINNERALVAAISGVQITLKRRGTQGTVAKAHAILSPVTFGLATDFPVMTGEGQPLILVHAFRDVVTIGADGAIPLPNRDTLVIMKKATAGAFTLADPANVPDGTQVVIVSKTAVAHVVTLTTGYGGSNTTDVFTWTTTSGTALTLYVVEGKWVHAGVGLDASEAVGVAVG